MFYEKSFDFDIFLISFHGKTQIATRQNSLYGELLGNGGVLSVNYERQFSKKTGLGFHAGLGLGNYKPAIPFGLKYLLAVKKEKSFIETGIGITLAEIQIWSDKLQQTDRNPYKAGVIPSFGYRHHTGYGLMWRFNLTPVFTAYRTIWPFGSFSVGYRF